MVSELATAHQVHLTRIHQGKRAVLEGAVGIFERGGKAAIVAEIAEDTVRDLHAKIAELAVANVFCPESSSLGPGSEARDDRTKPSQAVGRGTVSTVAGPAVIILRHAAGRNCAEP